MTIAQARENLINNQIRPWGGLNYKANNALMGIPRELFTPKNYKKLAFSDIKIPLNSKTTMFEPKVEGRILDSVAVNTTDKVLEIGTGSGYLTACLSILADSVVSVEIDEELNKLASEKLKLLNIDNVKLEVVDASGRLNYEDFFDVVIVGCSVPKVTGRYFHLLNVGGRIFVIEGVGKLMQAKLITRVSREEWKTEVLFETNIDTMVGLEPAKKFSF